jgi:hypothetical protein
MGAMEYRGNPHIGMSGIEKLKNISSSYHPMRNNATFCQMLDTWHLF